MLHAQIFCWATVQNPIIEFILNGEVQPVNTPYNQLSIIHIEKSNIFHSICYETDKYMQGASGLNMHKQFLVGINSVIQCLYCRVGHLIQSVFWYIEWMYQFFSKNDFNHWFTYWFKDCFSTSQNIQYEISHKKSITEKLKSTWIEFDFSQNEYVGL